MSLAEAVTKVLDRFKATTFNGAPLRVYDDASLINPPCIWLPVPGLEFAFNKGTTVVSWTAYLIAPNNNTVSVSQTLSQLLDAVAGLFPFTEARAQPLSLPGGGQPHPSYAVTWQSRIQIGAS